ncbi:hypothetical protein Tco_0421567 [Tanacetum coccineum]
MVVVGVVMMMTVVVWWFWWWGGSRGVAAWCWGGDGVLNDGCYGSSGGSVRGGGDGSVVTTRWQEVESPRLKDCPMNVLESLQTLSAEEKEDTSSSSIDYIPKSPTSSTSPSTNGYLTSPMSPPPRVPLPPPTHESGSMDITLILSPITPLDIQFNTPSPSIPSPPLFGHPIS